MSLFQFTLRIFLLKHIFATHSNSLVFFFKEETKVPCEKGQIEKSNYFYNFFMSAYINLPHSFFLKRHMEFYYCLKNNILFCNDSKQKTK